MLRSLAGVALLLSLGLVISGWAGALWVALLAGTAIALERGKRSAQRASRAEAGGPALPDRGPLGDVRAGLGGLDDLLFEGEKAVVGVSLLVMALVVFLDVVWRTSHSLEGPPAYGFAIGIFVLTMIGAFTARWEGATLLRRIAAGLIAFGLMTVACLVIASAPNGFGWSQTLAMVLLLWVSLIGSSMATKEGRHIAVDAVKRVVPERFKKGFDLAAGLVTVVVSTFLAILGTMYCRQNFVDWVESDFDAFIFESIPIPYWAASLPIAIGFSLTAARFVSIAIYGTKEVDVLTSVGASDLEAKP